MTQAAFFDVDKTVIARSSMVAFAPAFRREGLLRRRTILRAMWTQLLFVRFGAGAKKLVRLQRSVLALTRGWDQDLVRRVVAAELHAAIVPIAFTDALEAIATHQQAGRRVYLVSAAPEEVVGPLAAHLGVDGAIASQAEVDGEGRYTGRMGRYVYGPAKAEAIAEIARRDGITLADSWAYSDSLTDLPMLEAVGHPVVVNPDRGLRDAAREHGWPIHRFERLGPPLPLAVAAAVAEPTRHWKVTVLATAAAASGGFTAWRFLRHSSAPVSLPTAQLARSFFAANRDRPSRVARTKIFFMISSVAAQTAPSALARF